MDLTVSSSRGLCGDQPSEPRHGGGTTPSLLGVLVRRWPPAHHSCSTERTACDPLTAGIGVTPRALGSVRRAVLSWDLREPDEEKYHPSCNPGASSRAFQTARCLRINKNPSSYSLFFGFIASKHNGCDQLEGWDREGGIGRVGGRCKREGVWGYMDTYS